MSDLKRSELVPGIAVKNLRSGAIGMTQADPSRPGRLMRAHRQFICVKTVHANRRRVWWLKNVIMNGVETLAPLASRG